MSVCVSDTWARVVDLGCVRVHTIVQTSNDPWGAQRTYKAQIKNDQKQSGNIYKNPDMKGGDHPRLITSIVQNTNRMQSLYYNIRYMLYSSIRLINKRIYVLWFLLGVSQLEAAFCLRVVKRFFFQGERVSIPSFQSILSSFQSSFQSSSQLVFTRISQFPIVFFKKN